MRRSQRTFRPDYKEDRHTFVEIKGVDPCEAKCYFVAVTFRTQT